MSNFGSTTAATFAMQLTNEIAESNYKLDHPACLHSPNFPPDGLYENTVYFTDPTYGPEPVLCVFKVFGHNTQRP